MSTFPRRVLIANRGEIARRIIRACRELGVESVAIHHDVDADLPYVREADVAVRLDGPSPVDTYLDGPGIVAAALAHGATAIHPGYGFLSENAAFAEAVAAAGLVWIGPTPHAMRVMGDKIAARNAVSAVGVPVSGGAADALSSVEDGVAQAQALGFPVMLKAAAGGGGIGMVVASDEAALRKAFASTQSMAERSFGSGEVFLERFVAAARHIEVQVLGLADGRIVVLGERDCSVQRRHQKVAEECPPPRLSAEVRERLHAAAIDAAASVRYLNAGTVEFLLDATSGEFVFLEMNTRIQVEHPVTELTFGVDLIEQQLSIAMTGALSDRFAAEQSGHSLELRIYAEDPVRFFPAPGVIDAWREPAGDGIRVDSGFGPGNTVSRFFDPMLAKLCVTAPTRDLALERARQALDDFVITGVVTNIPFLKLLLDDDDFAAGHYTTQIVSQVLKNAAGKIAIGVN
jgi:acetyl-CoA carboxylase, biotin carboxylase subunit